MAREHASSTPTTTFVDRTIAWVDAQLRDRSLTPKDVAFVFDVDDTLLFHHSTSFGARSSVVDGFLGHQTRMLFHALQSRGDVVLVTARMEAEAVYHDTVEALRSAGIELNGDTPLHLCPPQHRTSMGAIAEWKATVRQHLVDTHPKGGILVTVGDSWGDHLVHPSLELLQLQAPNVVVTVDMTMFSPRDPHRPPQPRRLVKLPHYTTIRKVDDHDSALGARTAPTQC